MSTPARRSNAETERVDLMGPQERQRRIQASIANMREEATWTPTLRDYVQERIENNSFRRNPSDNPLYQRIANALKDYNIEDPVLRHPRIDDFLALEAITPVQYGGAYNRVITRLYAECDTAAWADREILSENHYYFRQELAAAKCFLQEQLSDDEAVLDQIFKDLDANHWRKRPEDHALTGAIQAKAEKRETLTTRDVLVVVALFGGQYPAFLLKHLIYNQSSEHLQYGAYATGAAEFATSKLFAQDLESAKRLLALVAEMHALAQRFDARGDVTEAEELRACSCELHVVEEQAKKLLCLVKGAASKEPKNPQPATVHGAVPVAVPVIAASATSGTYAPYPFASEASLGDAGKKRKYPANGDKGDNDGGNGGGGGSTGKDGNPVQGRKEKKKRKKNELVAMAGGGGGGDDGGAGRGTCTGTGTGMLERSEAGAKATLGAPRAQGRPRKKPKEKDMLREALMGTDVEESETVNIKSEEGIFDPDMPIPSTEE